MKISLTSDNIFYNSNIKKIKKNNNPCSFCSSYSFKKDCFEKQSTTVEAKDKTKKMSFFFKRFLSKGGVISKKEYSDILSNHPDYVSQAQSYISNSKIKISPTPRTIALVSELLKDNLDETYGKDNYTLLSIGTSPACISEVMQFLGADVKFISATNLSKYKLPEFRAPFLRVYSSNSKNMELFIEEVKKALEDAKSDNIIVFDYVFSGRSMENFHYLMNKNDVYGNKKISSLNLLDTLDKLLTADTAKKYAITPEDIDSLKEDFFFSRISNVSNIPHFDIQGQEDISGYTDYVNPNKFQSVQSQIKHYKNPYAKAFCLCAMAQTKK